MNNLKLNITVPNLSYLEAVGTNQYKVIIKFFAFLGQPLNSPYIDNSNEVIVTTTSPTFDVNVPVDDVVFSYEDVIIQAFANEEDDCCFGSRKMDLTNDGPVTVNNTLELSGYFGQ